MSFFFVIPAYKPDIKIIDLIKNLLKNPKAHITVVDDGSQNKTFFENSVFQDQRVSLLHHAVNLGKGAALKTAFNYLLVHFPIVTSVITLDADGQHTAHDAINIAQKVDDRHTLILGTRSFSLSDQRIPFKSRLGNVFTRLVWRLIIGSKVSDTQTGLRGIPVSLMRVCLHILPNRYEFEMEMLLKANELNMPIEEVPIDTIYIDQNRESHFNPFFDSLKIYFVLFRFSFSALISTIIDYAAFYLFLGFVNVGLSFIFARVISFLVNYNLNKRFVFRKEKGGIKFLLRYLVLFGANLYLGYSSIEYICFEGFSTFYSKILVDVILFFFNFFVQREWVFKNRKSESD
ncbi:MAG TPA: bifunctional glycosyltransferase family 2/GtrA family protein [Alphaproteobacteria bacterium]|nr:bifunctional glycosyltransferase family 2/GtrA family protein [Alphaproteobacteria bacterium]